MVVVIASMGLLLGVPLLVGGIAHAEVLEAAAGAVVLSLAGHRGVLGHRVGARPGVPGARPGRAAVVHGGLLGFGLEPPGG